MKKFLLAALFAGFTAAPVLAADLAPAPVYAKAPVIVPFSWTGCYAGVNVGGSWGKVKGFDPANIADLGSNKPTGVVGGGQLGCDYQMGSFVLGAEGMFDGASIKGSNDVAGTAPVLNQRENAKWLATATGRLGYAMGTNLLYVKGGGAWINEKVTYALGGVDGGTGKFTQGGYVVGGGWEWAFAPSWSTKIEYNYLDFGTKIHTGCNPANVCLPFQIGQTQHVVTAGVNYHFNWGGPVVAKY